MPGPDREPNIDQGVDSVNQKTLPVLLPSSPLSSFFEKDTCMNCHFGHFFILYSREETGEETGERTREQNRERFFVN